MCALEFVEEAHVILAEHAQVLDHIFQVGNAFHTQAEGITAVHLAVDAAKFEHVGVDHAAAENLHPTGMFAESAALAATDEA